MRLCVEHGNEMYFVERIVVTLRDDKFYLTIDSKYAITGLKSDRFRTEKDVMRRISQCVMSGEIFIIEDEFFEEKISIPYASFTGTDLSVIDKEEEVFANTIAEIEKEEEVIIEKELNSAFTNTDVVKEENKVDNRLLPQELLEVLDNGEVDELDMLVTDAINSNAPVKERVIPERPDNSGNMNPLGEDDINDIVDSMTELGDIFWGEVEDTDSPKSEVKASLDRQNNLIRDGLLNQEEVDKANLTRLNFVNLINREELANTDESSNSISINEFSRGKDDSEILSRKTNNKPKLSFRSVLKIFSKY